VRVPKSFQLHLLGRKLSLRRQATRSDLSYFGVRRKKVCPVTYFVASESK
jgi:hypothetical protein